MMSLITSKQQHQCVGEAPVQGTKGDGMLKTSERDQVVRLEHSRGGARRVKEGDSIRQRSRAQALALENPFHEQGVIDRFWELNPGHELTDYRDTISGRERDEPIVIIDEVRHPHVVIVGAFAQLMQVVRLQATHVDIDPLVDSGFSESPLAADLRRGDLSPLKQAINASRGELEVLRKLFGRKEVGHLVTAGSKGVVDRYLARL